MQKPFPKTTHFKYIKTKRAGRVFFDIIEKYGDKRDAGAVSVSISLDGKLLETIQKRQQVIDVDPITETVENP